MDSGTIMFFWGKEEVGEFGLADFSRCLCGSHLSTQVVAAAGYFEGPTKRRPSTGPKQLNVEFTLDIKESSQVLNQSATTWW